MRRAITCLATLLPLTALSNASFADDSGVRYDSGIRVDGEHGSLRLNTRFQARAELRDTSDTAFSLARIRLSGKGFIGHKAVGYKFQLALEKGQIHMKDLYTDLDLGSTKLRVGQSKQAWSRQQIASSSQLAIIERSITDGAFFAGRGIGLTLHNGIGKSKRVEWGVHATIDDQFLQRDEVTGTGNWNEGIDHVLPVVGGRIAYHSEGMKGYNEADREGGALRVAVGAGAKALLRDIDENAGGYGELDASLKVQGFNLLGAVYVAERIVDESAKPSGAGAHLQAGYMLGQHVQVAARTAYVDFDGVLETEVGGSVNVFLNQYDLYWQTGLTRVQTTTVTSPSETGYTAQSQVQLIF